MYCRHGFLFPAAGLCLLLLLALPAWCDPGLEMANRATIKRIQPPGPGEVWVPLYQGNGKLGGCWGPLGLHAAAESVRDWELAGESGLYATAHRVRLENGAEVMPPLCRLRWGGKAARVWDYRQEQFFRDGVVETDFFAEEMLGAYKVTLVSWFDPVRPGLCGLRIDLRGEAPPIRLEAPRRWPPDSEDDLRVQVDGDDAEYGWRMEVALGDGAPRALHVHTNAQTRRLRQGVELVLEQGRAYILLSLDGRAGVEAEASLTETVAWWREQWSRSAWVRLESRVHEAAFVRSLAYLLSSYRPGEGMPAPAHGITGNGPVSPGGRELALCAPALLWSGHHAIVQSWVEHWFTQPAPADALEAALLARAARETARLTGDSEWAARYADPLIRGLGRAEPGGMHPQAGRYPRRVAGGAGPSAEEAGDGPAQPGAEYPAVLDAALLFPMEPRASALASLLTSQAARECLENPGPSALPLFMVLAAAGRVGAPELWRDAWRALDGQDCISDHAIAFLARPGGAGLPYYLPAHALYVEAVLGALLSEWEGALHTHEPLPWKGVAAFGRLQHPMGVWVSGALRESPSRLQLRAWRAVELELNGRRYSLERGQEATHE